MNAAPAPPADRRPLIETELGGALLRFRGAATSVVLLGVVLNVLALAGSIYLMLVYDRVLPSASLASLFSLFAIVIVLYAVGGVLETMRARLLQLVGREFDAALAPRLQALESDLSVSGTLAKLGSTPMRDLDQVRGFLLSPGVAAILDLPWILFFLVILFLLHPWLGVTTLVGAILLALVTWLNDRQSRGGVELAGRSARDRAVTAELVRRNAGPIRGLAIGSRMNALAAAAHAEFVATQTTLSRTTAKFGAISRGLRMFVQSAVLTTGAILVIDGKATAGIIFASSILAGRALAPVDQAIANWRGFVSARQAWHRLDPLLRRFPAATEPSVMLEAPTGQLTVEQLVVAAPGSDKAIVGGVAFGLKAGDALAVVGPSGSGKSSLARALVGVWPAAQGAVRLDGAPLAQFHESRLREALGYLPQEVELFSGTVAQNISRFDPEPSSEAVIAAARAAGIHDLVMNLPQGFDTPVGEGGAVLSAGQRQRVALARALYGDPFVLVLDEPDSNLDLEGEAALAGAIARIRQRGGIAVVVTHRGALLKEVNAMLVMKDGRQQAFGPRDQVLAALNRGAAAANANAPDSTPPATTTQRKGRRS